MQGLSSDLMLITQPHDPQLSRLIRELEGMHSEMLNLANENRPLLGQIHRENRASAGNLLHYLALRRHDIRELQERLAALGLSSLGRTEAHALSAVSTVADVLSRLNRTTPSATPVGETSDERTEGRHLLERNAEALLERLPSTVPSASWSPCHRRRQRAMNWSGTCWPAV